MNRAGLFLFAGATCAAHAYANPLASAVPAPPADSIAYGLADTHVQLKLDLVIEGCPTIGSDQASSRPLKVKPTVTVTPVAVASPAAENQFRITGSHLASWWQKRDVAVTLNDNGTIKSIGVTSADRTAAIIGNVIKLGTSLATLGIAGFVPDGGGDPGNISACTPEVQKAVDELTAVRASIDGLQAKLIGTGDPVEIERLKKAIDRLAERAAELRSGPNAPLALSLSKTIPAPSAPGDVIAEWDPKKFKGWFGEQSPMSAAAAHSLGLVVKFALTDPQQPLPASQPLPPQEKGRWPYIAVREPLRATITVAPRPTEGVVVQGFDEAAAKTNAWVGQWGGRTYYRLRSGFGETKKLALELDPFGRKTAMTVNRDARAEAITGGLTGIADAAVAFQAATSDTRQQELRIKELETRQKYNKLMLCEAIIEEGGYTCPS